MENITRNVERYRNPLYTETRKFVNFEDEDKLYITSLQRLDKMNLSSEILKITNSMKILESIEQNPKLLRELKDPAVRLLNKWRSKLGMIAK